MKYLRCVVHFSIKNRVSSHACFQTEDTGWKIISMVTKYLHCPSKTKCYKKQWASVLLRHSVLSRSAPPVLLESVMGNVSVRSLTTS